MHPTPAGGIEYTNGRLNAFLDRLLTTADQTVFSHIDLGLGPNAQYEQADLLELVAHCGIADEFANGGAKTRRVATGEMNGLRNDHRSPTAKALGHHLRGLERNAIIEQFAEVFDEFRRLAAKSRLFTGPVDVAIDIHDWLYYGDAETEMVSHTNLSRGTNTAFKFLTACIVTDGLRLTVAVEPIGEDIDHVDALDGALHEATEWAEIRQVYLDRGFYEVAVLRTLQAHDLDYVVRARQFPSMATDHPTVQVEHDYVMGGSRPPYDTITLSRFCVPHREHPNEQQTYFVTNRPVDEEIGPALANAYRRRWGIETSYRLIGDFLAKSRSTVFTVRLFYFLFAVTLYNLWVLCNRLLASVFGWELDPPPISAAIFARLVRNRWMGELFDPG